MRETREARFERLLKDESFRSRYQRWIDDPVTKEVAEVIRDIYCRPTVVEGGINGEAAILAQGLTQGAWMVYDKMLGLKAYEEPAKDLKETYDDDEEVNKDRKAGSKNGET